MKTKLTTKRNDGRGQEWKTVITGYDCFETEDILVSYLNAVGCKTYLNAKQEVVACCKAEEVTNYMQKAEKLYNDANS